MKSSFSLSKGVKIPIALTILIAFLMVALFGFLFMGHHQSDTMAHAPSSCIAGVFEGDTCPETTTPLDFILFHFNALKTFSTAFFFVLIFVAAVFVLAFFRRRERPLLNFAPVLPVIRHRHLSSLSFAYRTRFLRWLVLHKKRDPFKS